MKILIAITLAAFSSAIRIQDEVIRYSSQAECDAIERRNDQYFYKFNERACACFFTWTYGSHYCRKPTTFNPFHEPFNPFDLCIPQEDYDEIFNHDLDANCQPKEQPRCTPSDSCWPSYEEWDQLNDDLDGQLLTDVKPYMYPCFQDSESELCQERWAGYLDANYRA